MICLYSRWTLTIYQTLWIYSLWYVWCQLQFQNLPLISYCNALHCQVQKITRQVLKTYPTHWGKTTTCQAGRGKLRCFELGIPVRWESLLVSDPTEPTNQVSHMSTYQVGPPRCFDPQICVKSLMKSSLFDLESSYSFRDGTYMILSFLDEDVHFRRLIKVICI